MKTLFLLLLIPNFASAGTQAECVIAARDFNDANKGRIEVGLDIKIPVSPTLAIALKKGHSPSMREGAALANVLRVCGTSSLGPHVFRLRIGANEGILCQQTNFDTMSATCHDKPTPVKFKAF